jgi:hypothetical protein
MVLSTMRVPGDWNGGNRERPDDSSRADLSLSERRRLGERVVSVMERERLAVSANLGGLRFPLLARFRPLEGAGFGSITGLN